MSRKKTKVAKRILEKRYDDQLSDGVNRGLRLSLYGGLAGVILLCIGMIEQNRMYLPYAIYSILEFALVYFFAREFQKDRKYSFLLIAIALFTITYLLERYHLGPLYEPMIDYYPGKYHNGVMNSIGLVKAFTVMAPTLYLWTKIVYILLWIILLINALRLKHSKF